MELLKKFGGVKVEGIVGSRLCGLAAVGNWKALSHLQASGVDLSTADYDVRTALHLAAAEGQGDTIGTFILAPVYIFRVIR